MINLNISSDTQFLCNVNATYFVLDKQAPNSHKTSNMKASCIQFLLLIVLAVSARAQMPGFNRSNGLLSITNLSAEDVLIEVDGQQFPDCGSALNLRGMRPGNHIIKVYSGKVGGALNM